MYILDNFIYAIKIQIIVNFKVLCDVVMRKSVNFTTFSKVYIQHFYIFLISNYCLEVVGR